MNRMIMVGTAAGGALLALGCGRRCGKGGRTGFSRMIERMPDDSPPKWMVNNITAIRENTERILQLLEGRSPLPGKGDAAPEG